MLIRIYLSVNGCHHTICTHYNTDKRNMFYDSKGRAMTTSQHMTLYWQHLLKAMGAKFSFPPHRCGSKTK